MRKYSKEKAKEVLQGNLLRLVGFNILCALPQFALMISLVLMLCLIEIPVNLPMAVIVVLAMLLSITVVTIGNQFSQIYGLINLSEEGELPTFKEAIKIGYKGMFKKLLFLLVGGFLIQLGTLLFIVPGVIVGIALSFSSFIILDEEYEDYSAMEVVRESFRLTNGYKKELFKLQVSFMPLYIGYILISFVSNLMPIIGVIIDLFATIYVSYYVVAANYNMYKQIKEEKNCEECCCGTCECDTCECE